MTETKIVGLSPEQGKVSERFTEMLSLSKFRRALAIAARQTRKTGLETGFVVETLPDSSFWIGMVDVGGTDSMENSRVLKQIDGPGDPNQEAPVFFHFHFHPTSSGVVAPSVDDLWVYRTKEEQPEHYGVGKVDNQGKIDILVITKPRYPLIEADIDFYKEGVNKIRNQEELQPLLSSIGLSSFVIQMEVNG
jgi:hypothetical protein